MPPDRAPDVRRLAFPPRRLMRCPPDAAVARLRARLGGRAWEDMADQRDTLARLIEAEERAAERRGVSEWGDLPGLRERLGEVTRWAAEGGALDGAAEGG